MFEGLSSLTYFTLVGEVEGNQRNTVAVLRQTQLLGTTRKSGVKMVSQHGLLPTPPPLHLLVHWVLKMDCSLFSGMNPKMILGSEIRVGWTKLRFSPVFRWFDPVVKRLHPS